MNNHKKQGGREKKQGGRDCHFLRPGVKLNDADLVGFPFQIRIGAKKFKEGLCEFYDRVMRQSEDLALNEVVTIAAARVQQAIESLNREK